MTQDHRGRHMVQRRSVLRAGAWTVHVVAVAAAAPSAAASPTPAYILLDSAVRINVAELQAEVSIVITDGGGNAIPASTDFGMTIDGHPANVYLDTHADVGSQFSGECSLDPSVTYTDYTTRLIIGAWTSEPLNVTVN